MQILVLHGPNLNLLGSLEPADYRSTTLAQIETNLAEIAAKAGFSLESFQSNHEGALVDRIQTAAREGCRFIIINPAAYTHTSVAMRDALAAVDLPFIEVHLSNIHKRETFRHHSFFSELALGVICGLGAQGYQLALTCAIEQLGNPLSKPA